jgi:hypothetical protein
MPNLNFAEAFGNLRLLRPKGLAMAEKRRFATLNGYDFVIFPAFS